MDFWKCISEQSVVIVTCNTVRSQSFFLMLSHFPQELCYSRRSLGIILAFELKFELDIVNILAYYVYKCFFWQREQVPDDYSRTDPEHKLIYRFVRTLFSAAQLTAECAIVTLVRECQPVWLVCFNNSTFNNTMRKKDGTMRGKNKRLPSSRGFDFFWLRFTFSWRPLEDSRAPENESLFAHLTCAGPKSVPTSFFYLQENHVMHCSPISRPVNVVLVVS